METITGANLYDYPKYYDLIFGSDWRAEIDFLKAVFGMYARRRVTRLFEPACGTGRLLYRLGKAGYSVSGIDLNRQAVRYCNDRLVRHGLEPTASVADMADFRLPRKVDAAFNMINSFRHLATENAARAHLVCMARAVAKGGLYVLGLHLTPTCGEPMDHEQWDARRGHLTVLSELQTVHRDLRRRNEEVRMSFGVYTPKRIFRLTGRADFRTYTARQMGNLLKKVPAWEPVATYSFAYQADSPIRVGPETEDVVYVLRKS